MNPTEVVKVGVPFTRSHSPARSAAPATAPDATAQNGATEQDDAPEEETAPEQVDATGQDNAPEQETAPEQKNRKAILTGSLIVLAILVIIVLVILLLRGCAGQTTGSRLSNQSSAPGAGQSAISIENRVHAALHSKTFNGGRLCTFVYIIEASTDHGVVATIRLTVPSASVPGIATVCENAVMAAVPEVTRVSVVDVNNSVVGSTTRK